MAKAHVVISDELLARIDRLVGKRRRSQFLAEAARQEVRRLELLQALQDAAGCWKKKDHPELRNGAAAWIAKTRGEDERRFAALPRRR